MNPASPDLAQAYSALELQQLGLSAADYAQVQEAMRALNEDDPLSVAEYGKAIATQTSSQTDAILGLVQNKQLDVGGEQLTEVLRLARQVNAGSLDQSAGKKGMLGNLLGRIKNRKDDVQLRFMDTRQQIDRLIGEVEQTQTGLRQRVDMLDDMYGVVQEEYRQLGIHIAAGLLKQQQLQQRLAALGQQRLLPDETDHQLAQQVFDLNQVASHLEKRVHDLQILQQSALQTLPTIRMIQNNNLALIDKFYAVRNITIPAWKNQMALALSLNEQKNSVDLANSIDDATNALLRRNAELLHQNSVNTARANQRAVIDMDTLTHVQNNLFKTVHDVIDIQKQGMQQRAQATAQLKQLQQQLNTLVIESSQPAIHQRSSVSATDNRAGLPDTDERLT